MRLAPIDEPKGLVNRVAYWMSRRQLGAVPSVVKVFYARHRRLAALGYRVATTIEKLSVGPELAHLVLAYTSFVNGCGFCADISRARAVQEHLGLEKFDSLSSFRTSQAFDARERAVLAYADEVSRNRDVTDDTFAALREHFDEKGIVEIVWLTAVGNYYNLMAVPLGFESDGLTEIALRRAGREGAAGRPARA